jgi:hypothetical protein
LRPLRWWAESAPPGGDRVKVSQNLGATWVAPVAPMDTSLFSIVLLHYMNWALLMALCGIGRRQTEAGAWLPLLNIFHQTTRNGTTNSCWIIVNSSLKEISILVRIHRLSRECVSMSAAGACTRRSLGHHLLHPLILRLLVLCAPADF